MFIFSIKNICCSIAQLCRLPSNIGFPNTSNRLIFLRCSVAVVYRCSSEFVLLKFSKISQENTCVEIFLNKVAGLQICKFIKKKLHYRCFCVKFPKFLHLLWLLLGTGINGNTIFLGEVRFYGVVGIIHEGTWFRSI